ncbi:hypothetical protein R6Q59_006992 [Mikania micrantha]
MGTDNKKRKNHYRPHNKSVKKGSYPLRPGVQGFFITCDGGRERQASQEAVQLIDSFLEELVEGKEPDVKHIVKPVNKKIKFSYSDSEEEDEDGNGNENGQKDKVVIASDHETQLEDKQEDGKNEDESQPEKKQKCTGRDESECEEVIKSKSVDQLIDAELDELKDKTKLVENADGCIALSKDLDMVLGEKPEKMEKAAELCGMLRIRKLRALLHCR